MRKQESVGFVSLRESQCTDEQVAIQVDCSVTELRQKYADLIESGRREGKQMFIDKIKKTPSARRALKKSGVVA